MSKLFVTQVYAVVSMEGKKMKKMFIAIVIGLVAALFGIPQCSEARTIDLAGGYIMEYDESSLYY